MLAYYLFGISLIILFLVFRSYLDLSLPISLLFSALLGSLISGLSEFWYRWFLGLGGVTDLLIIVALGILVVLLLDINGFFSQGIKKIDASIGNSYLKNLLKSFILLIPGMITGSFLVSGMIIKNNITENWLICE